MVSCFSYYSFHLIYVGFREHGDMAPDGSMQVWQPTSHVQTKFWFYLIPPPSRMGNKGHFWCAATCLPGILHCHCWMLADHLSPPLSTGYRSGARNSFWLSKLPCQAGHVCATSFHALFAALQISLRTTSGLMDRVRAVSMAVSKKPSTDSVSRCMHAYPRAVEPTPTASVNRLQIGRDEEATQAAGIWLGGWTMDKEIWIYLVRNFTDDQTTILMCLMKWPWRGHHCTRMKFISHHVFDVNVRSTKIYQPCPIKHRQCF